MAPELPEDLVETIQTYMPPKSLIRFKSVCKPWQTRIEDPHFIKIHSHNFCRPPKSSSVESHLITHPAFQSMVDYISEHEPLNRIYVYLSSCKGMVALFYMNESFSAQEIVLWNPAIKQSKCLPHSAAAARGRARIVSLGFGHDAARDDFKVVRVFCLYEMKLEAEVYSSVDDSWSAVDHEPRLDELTVRGMNQHVIVKGNPHWIAATKIQWINSAAPGDEEGESSAAAGGEIDDTHVLVGFDMTEESFTITPMPKKWRKMFLVDWDEAVGMVECVTREGGWLESLDVWVYGGDGERKWIRKASFGAVLDLKVDKCLAYCSISGRIVVGSKDGKVFIYDTKNHSVSVTPLKREGVELENIFWLTAYEENMVSVEGMTAAQASESSPELHGAINPIYGFIVSTVDSIGEIACYYRLASDDFVPPQLRRNRFLRCWTDLVTFIRG